MASRRLVVVLAAIAIAGCSAGTAPSGTSTLPAPTVAPTVPAASPTAAPTESLAAKKVAAGIAFEHSDPAMQPGNLDVYAPASSGGWPTVVMFHGLGGTRYDLVQHATELAQRGYVVFVPDWGTPADATIDLTSSKGIVASNAQNACAVAFAEAHSADYGGDPSTVIVFGHSAGAMTGAAVALAPEALPAGCLAGELRPVDALVTWEGDWLLSASFWNDLLAADSGLIGAVSVFAQIPRRNDLRVAELLGATSDMPDLPATDMTLRDPSGTLQQELAKSGALADGLITIAESQRLLFAMLQAQGNPATIEVMPESTHESVTGEGWSVFLAAFDRVAGR